MPVIVAKNCGWYLTALEIVLLKERALELSTVHGIYPKLCTFPPYVVLCKFTLILVSICCYKKNINFKLIIHVQILQYKNVALTRLPKFLI
jgi:hypothetical protein